MRSGQDGIASPHPSDGLKWTWRVQSNREGDSDEVALLLTAGGPLLILTSHESLQDQKLLDVLRQKGIGKFVAFEVPLSLARERYGGHFHAVESNLHETDDLRILDFNGQRLFQLFRFDELGAPILQEQL